MDGELVYLFRHSLLRDAAYQLQLPSSRGALHALAATIIADMSPGDDVALELANHAAHARENAHDTPGLREIERSALLRAAMFASTRSLSTITEGLYVRLSQLPWLGNAERANALNFAAKAAVEAGYRDRCVEHARRARELAAKADRLEEFKAARFMAWARAELLPPQQALAEANEVMELAFDEETRAQANMDLGLVQMMCGRTAEAEAALKIGAGSVSPRVSLPSRGNLAKLLHLQGRFAECEELCRSMLHETAGSQERVHASILNTLGNVLRETGRTAEARQCFEARIEIARRMGDREPEHMSLHNLAAALHDEGENERADVLFRQAIALAIEVGNERLAAVYKMNFSALVLEEGREAEALSMLEDALVAHRRFGNRRHEGVALGMKSEVLFKQGKLEQSRACCESALAIHVAVKNVRFEGVEHGRLALLNMREGKPFAENREACRAKLKRVGDQNELNRFELLWAMEEQSAANRS